MDEELLELSNEEERRRECVAGNYRSVLKNKSGESSSVVGD